MKKRFIPIFILLFPPDTRVKDGIKKIANNVIKSGGDFVFMRYRHRFCPKGMQGYATGIPLGRMAPEAQSLLKQQYKRRITFFDVPQAKNVKYETFHSHRNKNLYHNLHQSIHQ